ncbi:MAG: hypothetical protein A2958_01365 [Candidatus Levybacteria bacterium RIFCSPLOWO2_01_FULL_38_13]|nr:MAG: hypothetical protein A2629_01225 [Candidatus Levybacteria bacterium RIFCSPHIGHO2_01_FULL_41_15]OGH35799.1 MAG: hypothetical protein A2958_01365 [Candidatus Levybacteria bacterium RIFCSPLOWO2_01_FULL_38_13]
MNLIYHKNLSKKHWFNMRLVEQMANIGSEVERTIIWKNKGNKQYQKLAFERALELIDLTLKDPKNRMRLKELCRMREVLVDWYLDNQYLSTDSSFKKYFYAFNYAARI